MIRHIQIRAPMHDQVARHFEQRVADEEHACAESECRIGQAGIALQRVLGKADIRPVEKGEDVHQQQERQQPPYDPADRLLDSGLRRVHRGFSLSGRSIRPVSCDPPGAGRLASINRWRDRPTGRIRLQC